MTDKKITQFIRFTASGSVEKVSWFKREDGTKYATKQPFKAGRMDIAALKASQHQEVTL
jgi:hypothetical protein